MDNAISPLFIKVFAILIGEEGGYSDDPADPGNWTGGRVGVGELRGTKYGISAGAYPTVDIKALTLDAARSIYVRDYWVKVGGDELPAPVAMVVFDDGVNSGIEVAVETLQSVSNQFSGTLAVAVDGVMGPVSEGAAQAAWRSRGQDFLFALLAERLCDDVRDVDWKNFGKEWARRIIALAPKALALALEDAP